MLNPFNPQRVTDTVMRLHAANKRQLIRITEAKTALNQQNIRRQFGHDAPTTLFVDGMAGKPLAQAQEVTLTRFDLSEHVVDAALRMLIARSPVGPGRDGHYRDDHWLFVNNVRRDHALEGKPVAILPTDKVVIINMKPYARKLEGGASTRFRRFTNRRPGLSAQAPNGVYEITARDLQKKFGKIAEIRFTYRATMGGNLVVNTAPPRERHSMRGSRGRFIASGQPVTRRQQSQARFPALEITTRPGL